MLTKFVKIHEGEIGIIKSKYTKLCDECDGKRELIIEEIIKDIIKNNKIYSLIYTYLDVNSRIRFVAIQPKGNTQYYYDFKTDEFINACKKILTKGNLNFIQKKRIKNFISIRNYDHFLKHTCNIKIDEQYTIGQIFKLLTLSKDDFETFLENNKKDIERLIIIITKYPFNYKIDIANLIYSDVNKNKSIEEITGEIKEFNGYDIPTNIKEIIDNNIKILLEFIFHKTEIIEGKINLDDVEEMFKNLSDNEIISKLNKLNLSPALLANNLKMIKYSGFMPKEISDLIDKFVYNYSSDKLLEEEFVPYNHFFDHYKINQAFKDRLLKELPPNLTNLQKHYYLYKRVCQIFSYDDEFYAGNQKKIYSQNHLDYTRIETLDENNNIVVCYDATLFLAKLFEDLKSEIQVVDYDNNLSKKLSEHKKLKVKIDDYIISMDIAHGLIYNDMSFEKSFGEVKNFICLNSNERIINQFKEELQEVDKIIENNTSNILYDAIELYEKEEMNNNILTFDEKFKFYLEVLSQCNFKEMDIINFSIALGKMIFGKKFHNDFNINYVTNHNPENKNKPIGLSYILSIKINEEEIFYYTDLTKENPFSSLKKISEEELQEMFDNGTLEYNEKDPNFKQFERDKDSKNKNGRKAK